MNDGQIAQNPEPFTVGPESTNPEASSTAPEDNVNLENWSQDRDPSAIGRTAIIGEAGSLPLPPTEKPNLPTDVNNPTPENFATAPAINQTPPDLGKVESLSASDATANLDPATITDDSPTNYSWKQIMTRERLSKNTIKKVEEHIRKTKDEGNYALLESFMIEARGCMDKENPNNPPLDQEAA